MKKIYALPVLFALLIFLGAKMPDAPGERGYAGAETCLECHEDLARRTIKTPHFQAVYLEGPRKIQGCEACHGPGSIHAEDPEQAGSILSFRDSPPDEVSDACLSCHKKNHALKNFKKETQHQSAGSCLSCHSMHQGSPRSSLLADRQDELCFSCHTQMRAEFSLPFQHKIQKGRMTCWSCHDPHNTQIELQRMGDKKINETCFTCHPSQRGPFTYEHLGSNVGTCQACHMAHGSENARLLRRSSQWQLCVECHSGPSPADSLLGSKTPSFHITAKATYQNCTVCHAKIHGSYLSQSFLR